MLGTFPCSFTSVSAFFAWLSYGWEEVATKHDDDDGKKKMFWLQPSQAIIFDCSCHYPSQLFCLCPSISRFLLVGGYVFILHVPKSVVTAHIFHNNSIALETTV